MANASEFTGRSEEINVRSYVDGAWARIEVEDTGIGIDFWHIDDIFKPYSHFATHADRARARAWRSQRIYAKSTADPIALSARELASEVVFHSVAATRGAGLRRRLTEIAERRVCPLRDLVAWPSGGVDRRQSLECWAREKKALHEVYPQIGETVSLGRGLHALRDDDDV